MSEQAMSSVPITVGEQTFRVRIPAAEAEQYRAVAEVANRIFHEIEGSGAAVGPKALAMTAYQLAAELEETRAALRGIEASRNRLTHLIARLEQVTESD